MAEPSKGKLITIAIHTYEKAIILKALLEKEGIETTLNNVNLNKPEISSGVRVRIYEKDLPLALKLIEQSTTSTEPITPNKSKKNTPKILIPIDFSEYSIKACNIGFDFANKLDAKVVLLHSYLGINFAGSLPYNSDGYGSEIVNIQEDKELDRVSQLKMKNFVTKLKEDMRSGLIPRAEFKSLITEGVPEDAIIEEAKQMKALLVVMGTRGKDKKEAELIGSVTAEVLDSGKFPVFTVPENISINNINDIKNVVFFSNLCQQDLISFDIFARLFNKESLHVNIVPILDKKSQKVDERNRALLEYSEEHYPNFTFSIKTFPDDKFIKDFDNYIQAEKIDLIIIPNKKRNIFARLFNPSIAHKMLFHSDTPMLVVPV